MFIGSGQLGLPENALLAFALGCDMVNVGREAMLAIGCIQAQRCHTGRCPTGVTTHSRLAPARPRPERASERLANYLMGLRAELLRLARACGVPHPALVALEQIELLDGRARSRPPSASATATGWGLPGEADRAALGGLMTGSR